MRRGEGEVATYLTLQYHVLTARHHGAQEGVEAAVVLPLEPENVLQLSLTVLHRQPEDGVVAVQHKTGVEAPGEVGGQPGAEPGLVHGW